MEKFKNNLKFMGKVLKDVPAILFALVAMTLFIMNVLAGKSLALNVSFLALDAGIIVSWLVYLILDIVTKRFGPKHANVLSVVSVLISVFFCLILFFPYQIIFSSEAVFISRSFSFSMFSRITSSRRNVRVLPIA